MRNRAMSKVDDKILAAVEEDTAPAGRIWCDLCGTDEYVLIEMARWRRRYGVEYWEIDYTCTKCDSFYGHVVKDPDVTPALAAALSVATKDMRTA